MVAVVIAVVVACWKVGEASERKKVERKRRCGLEVCVAFCAFLSRSAGKSWPK